MNWARLFPSRILSNILAMEPKNPYEEIMQRCLCRYAGYIFTRLKEWGINTNYSTICFLGGGGRIVKAFGNYGDNICFCDDMKINANRYEFFEKRLAMKQRHSMKKGDDFFRVTFNRSSEEVQRFEKNISDYTDKNGISRPAIIVAICNYFFENNMKLSVVAGKYVVKGFAPHMQSISENHSPVVTFTEFDEQEYMEEITDADSDEMLRAMGML